jgi:glucuronoarabinoxylan endo-1,4-beta-xylanase
MNMKYLSRWLLVTLLAGGAGCASSDALTPSGDQGGTPNGGKSGVGGSSATGGSGAIAGAAITAGTGAGNSVGGSLGVGGANGGASGSAGGFAASSGSAALAGGAGSPAGGAGGRFGGRGGAPTGGAGAAGAGKSGAGAGGSQAGSGGTGGMHVGTKTPGMAQSGDITVNPATAYQTMDGFGIADVWQNKSSSTSTLTTLLFDPDQGIGLTLLRIGIDGTSGKPNIMGDAAFVDGPAIAKFGGKVWAAPWSPPANMKDNNNVNNGGHLTTSDYDSWASVLAAFPAYYKQQSGVDLYAVSAQNEPDFTASYQSCLYDKTQMNNFIKVLAPKLAALNPPVGVLAAEPDVWNNLWSGDNYGTAILGDSSVSPLVTVLATHDYGSNTSSTTRPAPPAGANTTHHLWETEITYSSGAAINAGLDIARGIYAAVTAGGVNGWHYWWTESFLDGGSATNPPKRVYAMGNFSKFVRPGYVRVAVTGAPSSVQIVPFVSPADGTTVIVALNSGSSAVQASFFVGGSSWPASVIPYVTSASSNLAPGTALPVTDARFSGSLAAQSITTFVGKP